MSRWRLITLILVILAVGLWAVLLALNLRPELAHEVPRGFVPSLRSTRLGQPLFGLPGWVSSLELFVTLFLVGAAGLYLVPLRVRNMARALAPLPRVVPITLLGLGFVLLSVVFGLGAVLARITFPFMFLAGLAALIFSTWGYVVAAYALGRTLLRKAGWQGSSPLIGLALGLLLLLPLARIPFVGGLVMLIYAGLGLGLVIATRFGSNERWSLTPLLEEDLE